MINHLCDECAEHFEKLQNLLKAAEVSYQINPYIVRGLDYYTKTVFEIISNEIGAQGTVCGGGRYDGLIKQLGGPELPGIGFGMGMERLLMVMDGAGVEIPEPDGPKAFIATMGDAAREAGFKLLNTLRKSGVSADMDHAARSLKAQFKYADKLRAQNVIVIGDSELEKGMVQLRDMKNSTQREVAIDKILGELLK